MGKLEELLAEHGSRIGMFLGYRDFRSVRAFILGFDKAICEAFGDEATDLLGFREWLIMNLDVGPKNHQFCWPELIRGRYGDGEKATDKFLELYNQFRLDVRRRGLGAILKAHYDFEVERYGRPCVSNYYRRGHDKKLAPRPIDYAAQRIQRALTEIECAAKRIQRALTEVESDRFTPAALSPELNDYLVDLTLKHPAHESEFSKFVISLPYNVIRNELLKEVLPNSVRSKILAYRADHERLNIEKENCVANQDFDAARRFRDEQEPIAQSICTLIAGHELIVTPALLDSVLRSLGYNGE